jgi:hypothetical protein
VRVHGVGLYAQPVIIQRIVPHIPVPNSALSLVEGDDHHDEVVLDVAVLALPGGAVFLQLYLVLVQVGIGAVGGDGADPHVRALLLQGSDGSLHIVEVGPKDAGAVDDRCLIDPLRVRNARHN